ncbi:MAG: hypothetical protein H6Q73_828 [Firmicutes bacterium]|nr:hypothetical protein [Bacillota bacterium]
MFSLMGLMLAANVGMAAPAVDLEEEQVALGLTYSSPSASISNSGLVANDPDSNVGLFVIDKLDKKLTVVGEAQSYSWSGTSLNSNDAYAKYKVAKNVQLIAGFRWWSDDYGNSSDSQFLYGVGIESKLDDKLTGYIHYKKADITTDYDFGVTYDMTQDISLNLSHRTYKVDLGSSIGTWELKGVSLGLIYKL